MQNETAIELPHAPQTPPVASAITVIQQALASGATPETLRELLNVRREWEADEARKAFHLAVAAFQSRAPIIEKGDKAVLGRPPENVKALL